MSLRVFNTSTGQKEEFIPLREGRVGMYVCGVTVYDYCHIGHARAAIVFDTVYRYLQHLGYEVNYVCNFTDIDDKIIKRANEENIGWQEVTEKYIQAFYEDMGQLNITPPTTEPKATDHIGGMLDMVSSLIEQGKAYEAGGDVYFAVRNFPEYGKLSGRNLDDLKAGARVEPSEHKRDPLDFALWKKSKPGEPSWDSPWGPGRPGWHIECSAMSRHFLGTQFDIHGGGKDLVFPHHENEIAQSQGCSGTPPVKYWLHTNMLTVNGQKMSKSLGNSFLPSELISGNHELLDQPYSPMTVRFFMLQSHYSSTLDFSNDALKAARKGYKKLANGFKIIKDMEYPESLKINENADLKSQIISWCEGCKLAMNDDFNTTLTIANLFNLLKKINSLQTGNLDFSELSIVTFGKLKQTYTSYFEDILGLIEENPADPDHMIRCIVELYKDAKHNKDYEIVDKIRR
ncbi:MAG: cysteine--tRNA ligase, partial [Nitrospinae bacterium]|nr:cysteine--tRNA ligase [Nitrospinota bacterium]